MTIGEKFNFHYERMKEHEATLKKMTYNEFTSDAAQKMIEEMEEDATWIKKYLELCDDDTEEYKKATIIEFPNKQS